MVPPTKLPLQLSSFVFLFIHLGYVSAFAGLVPPPREADIAKALDYEGICAHLILNVGQDRMDLGPRHVASIDALIPQIDRLAILLDSEIAESANTEAKLYEEASASSWGLGFGLRILNAVATPATVTAHRQRIEVFEKRRKFLKQLQAVVSTVEQLPALGVATSEPNRPTIHPDEDLEAPIAEWFADRATESATALLRVALADTSQLPKNWEAEVETRLASLEVATKSLFDYLKLESREGVRNPFRAEFLDHVAMRRIDEVQAWAEQEFQGPVERDWVVRLTGTLAFQNRHITERFAHMAWMKQELELANDAEGREDLLAHLEVAFHQEVDLVDVVQRSKDFKVAAKKARCKAEHFKPRHHAMLAQYSFQYDLSVDKVMLELRTAASSVATFTRETESSPEFILLITQSGLLNGQGDTFVSTVDKLYRGFDFLHIATANRALDAAYVTVLAQLISQPGNVVEATALLKHAADLRRITGGEEFPGGVIDSAYRISDWVRFAAFAHSMGIADESMAHMIRRSGGVRRAVQPAGRVLGAIEYAFTAKFGVSTPARAQLSGWLATTEDLIEFLYVPLVMLETPFHRLVVGAHEPGYVAPTTDIQPSVSSWDVVPDVAPDAYLLARFLPLGPTTLVFIGDNGPQFRSPALPIATDRSMGLPMQRPLTRPSTPSNP